MQLLTYSSKRAFRECRKRFWFAYEKMLRPVEDARALRIGRAMHKAIELWRTGKSWIETLDDLSEFDRLTCWALMVGYTEHWSAENCGEEIATEQSFELRLRNPDQRGGTSHTFRRAGKIDGIVRLPDGRVALRETKTTSESIDSEFYWRHLMIDNQVTDYWLAALDMEYLVEVVIYDVIRKPSMAPHKATPIEKRKYTKNGTLYAAQRLLDETPEKWGERLLADIRSRPEFYYQHREIVRLDQQLNDSRYDAWDTARDIADAQRLNRWYPNPSSRLCRTCAYFDLCVGLTPWDGKSVPEGFQRIATPHPELENNNGTTNSSSTTETAAESQGVGVGCEV